MMSEKLLMSLLRVIFLWATLCTIASSPQQKCYLSVPLSGPELYYIMREDICSVIVDWSDDIMINADSDRCEEDDISRYEVEVNFMSYCINKSRVFQTVPTGTMYDLSAFLSGINVDSECESATSNCYRHQARIRAQLGNSSWSHYSTWTTVSNTYRTVRVCVTSGATELCLPVQGCGEPGFSIFVSNQSQELHYLGDDTNHLRIEARRICFKDVTRSIHYVEFCHKRTVDCHNQDTNIDSEISIQRSTTIEVKTGHCDTCPNPMEMDITGSDAMLNSTSTSILHFISHCEISESSGFLQNICFTFQDDILPITINYMQYTNKILSDNDILCRDNYNITVEGGRYEILNLPDTQCDEISDETTAPSSTKIPSSTLSNVAISWPVMVTSSALLSGLL